MTFRRLARALRFTAAVALVLAVLSGCGADGEQKSAAGEVLPDNVTIKKTVLPLPKLPEELSAMAGRLAGLVDWHEEDFSGSWYDPETGELFIGVVTAHGRELLENRGLDDNPTFNFVDADLSSRVASELADDYQSHSAFGDRVVGWGALPEGDGIHLMISGTELTEEQLTELAELPVRVVIETGRSAGTLD